MVAIANTHIDRPLSEVAFGYDANEEYIAEEIFTPFFVSRESDQFTKYDKSKFQSEGLSGPRGPYDPSTRATFGLSQDEYELEFHSLYTDVPSRLQNNADAPIDLEWSAAENIREKLLIEREIDAASMAFDSDNVGTTKNLNASKWSDDSNDPVADINDAFLAIAEKIGKRPNAMVIAPNVWSKLSRNQHLLSERSGVREGSVTPQRFASYFTWMDVQNLWVPLAIKNTATEGQDDNENFIWKDKVLLFYRDMRQRNNPLQKPTQISYARNFRFEMDALVRRQQTQIPAPDGVIMDQQIHWGYKILDKDCAYLFENVI